MKCFTKKSKDQSCCKSNSCDGKCDDMKCLSEKYKCQANCHKKTSRCFYGLLIGAIFLSSILIFIYLTFCHCMLYDCISCDFMLWDRISCHCVGKAIRTNFWLSFFSLIVLSIFLISICILIRNKAREESAMSAEYMHKSYAIQGFSTLMDVAEEKMDAKEMVGGKKVKSDKNKMKEKLLNEAIEVIRTNPRINLINKNRDDY